MSSENLPAENQQEEDANVQILRENHQFEYSMAVLKAQERDRESQRAHVDIFYKSSQKMWIWISGFVLIAILVAFWFGKEDFLLECVKLVTAACGGGGVGYVIGYRKKTHEVQS